MKPIFETILPNPGNSFFMICEKYGATEPFWHIHPEYELVYIKNGSAEQHIGSHFSKYVDGTLLFIGPNIPHSNMGNFDNENNTVVVLQMSKEFLENKILSFNELKFITDLLTRSQHGICFGKETQKRLSNKMENLISQNPYHKLIGLIDLLKELSLSEDYTLLNSDSINIVHHSLDYSRINQINQFVSKNYQNQIQLSDLANIVGLTESSFSRFFKKITGKTFITFLNEFRIQKACMMLSDKRNNISEIMYETGFNEAAHFTRVFKKYTSYTPREFRNKLIQSPRLNMKQEE